MLMVIAAITGSTGEALWAQNPGSGPPVDPAGAIDAMFRLRWSHPGRYRIAVRVPESSSNAGQQAGIFDVDNECRSAATTGCFERTADGQVLTIDPPTGVAEGAVRFRIRGGPETQVSIGVVRRGAASQGEGKPERIGGKPTSAQKAVQKAAQKSTQQAASTAEQASTVAVRLSELLSGDAFPRLEDAAASDASDSPAAASEADWQLQRLADDRLHLTTSSDDPIHAPGDRLAWTARVNSALDHSERSLAIHWSLHRVSDGSVVAEEHEVVETDARGCSEPVELAATLPETAGVYELRCRLAENRDLLWSRLRGHPAPLAEIARPLVITRSPPAPESAPAGSAGDGLAADALPWETIARTQPSEDHSWTLASWLPAPGNPATLFPEQTSGIQLQQQSHAGESVTAIPPGRSFQTTLPVQRAGEPHQITIRCAAGRPLQLRLKVFDPDSPDSPHGDIILRQPHQQAADDRWRTHTWLVYPSGADQQIRVTNLDSHHPAWFESIRVAAGPERLPPAPAGPATGQRLAVLRLTDFHWYRSLTMDLAESDQWEDFSAETISLHRLFLATERLQGYLAATGFNGVLLPGGHAGRLWYRTDALAPLRGAHPADRFRLDMVLSMFDSTGYRVWVGVEPSGRLAEVEKRLRAEPDLAPAVRRSPLRRSGEPLYQAWHPLTRDALAGWLSDLSERARRHRSFAGVALGCGSGTHAAPPRPDGSAGDESPDQFLKSAAATSLSAEEANRWLPPHAGESLAHWQRRLARQAYQEWAAATGEKKLLLLPGPESSSPGDTWHASLAREWSARASAPAPVQALRPLSAHSLSSAARHPVAFSEAAPADSPSHGAVLMGMVPAASGRRSGVRRPAVQTDALLGDLTRCAHRLAPEILIFELPVALAPVSDEWTETLKTLTALPGGAGAVVEPSDPANRTVGLRWHRGGDRVVVAIANFAPWASEVELHLSSPAAFSTLSGLPDPPASGVTWSADGKRLNVHVPPGRTAVLAAPDPELVLQQWLARPSGGSEAVARIKQQLSSVVERLGTLSDFRRYSVLANGGFEQQAGESGLSPWLHAQYPPEAVRVDPQESIEGNHSALLINEPGSASRTWLVSETIAAPRSGRLAVSLACRSERKADQPPHRLRIAIEATRDGEPMRQAAELEVPSNGHWQPREVVLEVTGVDPAEVQDLRLTIDNLSSGRVWLDDIRLHDWFPLASERSELQNQAFLAVQGLQRGNLTAASRLLQNFWAQYLLAVEPPVAIPRESPTAVDAVDPVKQPVPGVAERIRNWLPQSLRF